MEPINRIETGCTPISSNCVIWQGPDIKCINLCKGDTVSTVVNKLATELCTIIDTLDISNYDLSCLNLTGCNPKSFTELLNILIQQVCSIENIPGGETGVAGCPDCVVPVCTDLLANPLNPQGDLITSMQLKDYVIAIGSRVCSIIGQITTINNSLDDHEDRITILENTPAPTVALPTFNPACILNTTNVPLEDFLITLEKEFCKLETATGQGTALLTALQATCQGLNNSDQLNGTGLMKDIVGWYQTPTNLAQSFSNLWKTVCDLRGAVTFMQNNCCNTDCNSINLQVAGSLNSPNILLLNYNGSIPNNYVDSSIGSSIEITDSSGGGPQIINGIAIKSAYYDSSTTESITLVGVNGANDLTVKITYRFMDPSTGSTCENIVQLNVLGTDTCPDLTLVPNYTSINYSFNWIGTTPIVIVVELWNSLETINLQTTTLNVTTNNPSSQFLNLVEGTTYKIRLKINGVYCEFEEFKTLIHPCVAATLNSPTIDYTDPEGDTEGNTIEGWQITYNGAH